MRNAASPVIAVLTAFAVCFVVVCPLTPTPIAVGKNSVAVAVVALFSVLAAGMAVGPQDVPRPSLAALHPEDLVTLTCTRLC